MVIYSNSRISTFEQCKYKYKLQYIEKIRVPQDTTVEQFLGIKVHEALEKLYAELHFKKLTKEEVIQYYEDIWDYQWNDNIVINNIAMKAVDYKKLGVQYLTNYYDQFDPFDQNDILGTETKDRLQLRDDNQYHVMIDRLDKDEDGIYYVCDYKTNKNLKTQSELDQDRQLAMYSLWVHEQFPDAKDVQLVWYFLAHNTKMTSKRTKQDLIQLKTEVEDSIDLIESTKEFPENVSGLCDWCQYKFMCPAWQN
jgi:putative RecB family exonuclease